MRILDVLQTNRYSSEKGDNGARLNSRHLTLEIRKEALALGIIGQRLSKALDRLCCRLILDPPPGRHLRQMQPSLPRAQIHQGVSGPVPMPLHPPVPSLSFDLL